MEIVSLGMIMLGAFAAGISVLIAIENPKFVIALSVLGILFSNTVVRIMTGGTSSIADEVIVAFVGIVFPMIRLVKREPLRRLPGDIALVGFFILGLLGAVASQVDLTTIAISAFLTLKLFVFAFGAAQVNWLQSDLTRGIRIAVVVIGIAVLCAAVNFVIPTAWSSYLSRRLDGAVDYRFGFASLIGPFDHEVAFGQFMALAFLAAFSYRIVVNKSHLTTLIIFFAFLGTVLSFRRKAIAALLLGSLYITIMTSNWIRGRTRFAGILMILFAALLAIPVMSYTISLLAPEYFGDILSPREIMTRDSITVARQYFPLGAGFGQFGSYMASVNYSPLYFELGYSSIYGLGQGDLGLYLNDTFWPMVIGETGFFGALCFLGVLFRNFRSGYEAALHRRNSVARWFGILTSAWIIEYLVESIATPVFSSPPIFCLLGLAISINTVIHSNEDNCSESELYH
jgi:hypothetical protein